MLKQHHILHWMVWSSAANLQISEFFWMNRNRDFKKMIGCCKTSSCMCARICSCLKIFQSCLSRVSFLISHPNNCWLQIWWVSCWQKCSVKCVVWTLVEKSESQAQRFLPSWFDDCLSENYSVCFRQLYLLPPNPALVAVSRQAAARKTGFRV